MTTLGTLLRLDASDAGSADAIPLHIDYDKAIWSGLSWATARLSLANAANVLVPFLTPELNAEPHLEAFVVDKR